MSHSTENIELNFEDGYSDNVQYGEVTCCACGRPCNLEQANTGTGHSEFWGTEQWDVKVEWVSGCCHSDWVEQ